MPTFGSLFAGIGGIDLGLERAGWTCRWQVEIDDYCRRVLSKHWPDIPKYGDVRELTGTELESVDLIAGGFPCQPTSRAGRRRHQADERWLWPEFARLIRVARPRFALMENPPGLLDGPISEVLRDLAEHGYDAEWGPLGADDLGASQHRERIWILAYAYDAGLQGRVGLGEPPAAWETRTFAHSESLRSACGFWPPGPRAVSDIPRMADGPAHRVDRLRALGNAVVPQVAQWVGRRILEAMTGERES